MGIGDLLIFSCLLFPSLDVMDAMAGKWTPWHAPSSTRLATIRRREASWSAHRYTIWWNLDRERIWDGSPERSQLDPEK